MTDRVVKHSAGLPREFAVEVTPGGDTQCSGQGGDSMGWESFSSLRNSVRQQRSGASLALQVQEGKGRSQGVRLGFPESL